MSLVFFTGTPAGGSHTHSPVVRLANMCSWVRGSMISTHSVPPPPPPPPSLSREESGGPGGGDGLLLLPLALPFIVRPASHHRTRTRTRRIPT